MEYLLSFLNPTSHFIHIKFIINSPEKGDIYLAIPTWRPGRYEAANFAKNIRGFNIHDEAGNPVLYRKVNHSTWKVNNQTSESLIVSYDYFAYKMDAGNSWFDDQLIYINFINCLVYVKNRQTEKCTLTIDVPNDYRISCGLKSEDNTIFAKDYYQLVDSPLIASADLQHHSYRVFEMDFHVWIIGNHTLNINKLLDDFRLFSEFQVSVMASFPDDTYHFQIILLPYKFYHGVEHHNSTVICLGPGETLNTDDLYGQLLGVSSHELFHAWNIIKIRPKELMPYNFNEDVFFPTGYVAEGFTTYYGDLFLVKSKVYDKAWYYNELNTLFKRHFLNDGRLNYSVIDSSLDLWLDGYTPGIPHRKSSIYVEGAVVALMLDLMIRKKFGSRKSLDDVMRALWKDFGQPGIGYSHQDIVSVCETVYEESLRTFFADFVEGTKANEYSLNELLFDFGCELVETESESILERHFGVKVLSQNEQHFVSQTALNSIGENYFSINDEILAVNDKMPSPDHLDNGAAVRFRIKRNQQDITFSLTPSKETYFKTFRIREIENMSESQQEHLNHWLGK